MIEMIELENVSTTQYVLLEPQQKILTPFKLFSLFILNTTLIGLISAFFYWNVLNDYNTNRKVAVLEDYRLGILNFGECNITTDYNYTDYIGQNFVIWVNRDKCDLFIPSYLYNYSILIFSGFICFAIIINVLIFKIKMN